MIYNTGTVKTVSGAAIVKGTGTKWNSNNPLVSPGMLMLIKNGDMNYPCMIKAVNSDTELVLADKPTFDTTDKITQLISPNPTIIVMQREHWLLLTLTSFTSCKIWTHG
ncbi:MAG: hypothetical protein AB8W32_10890 [Arsenophonus endosymbiont of Dermacentor nuttalli]